MRTTFLKTAGMLALLAVLGKFYAIPAIAQAARAALVKSVDERGRTPYHIYTSCLIAGSNDTCTAHTPAIPANKRLVLEHVNAEVDDATTNPQMIRIGNQLSTSGINLQLAKGGNILTVGTVYFANQPVLEYYDAGGASPSVTIITSTNGGNSNWAWGQFTLSGYLIDLTQ